jgi:hypothetical protein
MSRSKLSLSAVLVVFVVSAITAGTASAEFTLTAVKCEGTVVTLCYSTTEGGTLFEFEGSQSVLANLETGTELLIAAKFGTEEVHVVCTGATAEGGEFLQASPLVTVGTVDIPSPTFTGCALLEPLAKKCKVPTTLSTNAITGTPSSTEVGDVLFKPTSGTVFIAIVLENNGTETCPATLKGTKSVTGEQLCSLIAPETDKTLHTLECLESGSKLKFGENAAELKLSLDVVLAEPNTDLWSLSKG